MEAGPIGLVTMMAARAFSAPYIVIINVDDYQLSVADQDQMKLKFQLTFRFSGLLKFI